MAGDKVTTVPDPIDMDAPRIKENRELTKLHPDVFSSCVVTRAMAKKCSDSASTGDVRDHTLVDLTFLCDTDSESSSPLNEDEHGNADGDVGDRISVDLSETILCDTNSVEPPDLTSPLNT